MKTERKINNIDQIYAEHEKFFVEKRNKVESFLEKVKFAGNLANNVLEKGSDEEIIETLNVVKERVEMVTKNESESMKNLPELTGINQDWFVTRKIDTEMVSKLFGPGIIRLFINIFISNCSTLYCSFGIFLITSKPIVQMYIHIITPLMLSN